VVLCSYMSSKEDSDAWFRQRQEYRLEQQISNIEDSTNANTAEGLEEIRLIRERLNLITRDREVADGKRSTGWGEPRFD